MICDYCDTPWTFPSPLKYHGEQNIPNAFHCKTIPCSFRCRICRDKSPAAWTVRLSDAEMRGMRVLAERRQGSKDSIGVSTDRFFKDRCEEDTIGLFGELAFEKITGEKMDREIYHCGDNGRDFVLAGRTVDVKTARKPYNLIVKAGEIHRTDADIFILSQFIPPDGISFLGWETIETMKTMPTRDFGYGIVNHFLAAEKLLPMHSLP